MAARSRWGFFRKVATPDPYFIIAFRSKRYAAEHRSQTPDPVWNSPPFQLGWINGVEKAELKLQLFDHNVAGADDCIGMIRIPGHFMYHLGLGDHVLWFMLTSSKRRIHGSKAVSGRILMQFRIDECRHDSASCPSPLSRQRTKSDRTEFHNLTNMGSGEISGAPRDSGTRVRSKEKVSASLHRSFTRLMVLYCSGQKGFIGLCCSGSKSSACNPS